MCTQTARARLHASGLNERNQIARPQLTGQRRNCRLRFAARCNTSCVYPIFDMLIYPMNQMFCLDFHDGHIRVWRQKKRTV